MTTGSLSAAHLTDLTTALAGRYRLERELGAGGMATVWLAEDVRHGRRVAIKVLHPALSAVLGPERFLKEIEVTARLQHPHILPLFDSGSAEGLLYYVMPYVEGETLRARLERERHLPVADAVRIATEIADALDYAHRHGVVHRDIKPENILLHDGHVAVADFGIALAVQQAGGERMTQTGLSLGTPQYMSPEQAMGERHVDARADVYALGAVTYEMLAGEPPFTGPTAQAIVARVMTERARDLRVLRPSMPEHVALAVETALEKLPADRWTTAREFAEALAGQIGSLAATTAAGRRRRPPRRLRDPLVLGLGALALTALAAAGLAVQRARAVAARRVQFVVRTRDSEVLNVGLPGSLAVSPDGRAMVYVAGTLQEGQLFLRRLDQVDAVPLGGTRGARRPFFSPDGRWIGFTLGDRLMKVSVDGGSPTEIVRLPRLVGATWAPNGTIVVASDGRLLRLPEGGGSPAVIVNADTVNESWVSDPLVLPDGRTIVYRSVPREDVRLAVLAVTTLDGAPALRTDLRALAPVGFVRDRLLYVDFDGRLLATPFDARRRRVTGPPAVMETDVLRYGISVAVSLSANGTMTYAFGSRVRELAWVEENGSMQPAIVGRREYDLPRLSPDGKRIAVFVHDSSRGIWLYDTADSSFTQLTADTASYYGEWAPDGRSFFYSHLLKVHAAVLLRQPIDGSGPAVPVLSDSTFRYHVPHPDGFHLLLLEPDPPRGQRPSGGRLQLRRVTGDTTTRLLGPVTADQIAFRISPDGRWVAYADWAGSNQVFVRPLLGGGPRVQVSTTGGMEPVWSRDGRRLFFRDLTGRAMYAADIETSPTFRVLGRRRLFEGTFDYEYDVANYDVTPDGKRFLMVRTSLDDVDILVTTGWDRELGARLGERR